MNENTEPTLEEKAVLKELESALDDITFNYPSVGKRILAYAIDIVVSIMIGAPLLAIVYYVNENHLVPSYGAWGTVTTVLALIGLLAPLIYLGLKDGLFKGRSVGRRLTGIIILKFDCVTPPNVFQSAIRQLPFFGASSVVPMLGGLFELYYMYTKPFNIRLGDALSRTATFNYADYEDFMVKFNEVDQKQIVPTKTLKQMTNYLFRQNILLGFK